MRIFSYLPIKHLVNNSILMNKFLTLIILALTLLSQVAAQEDIPVDFEYLDHRERTSRAGATALTPQGILYVSHHDKGVSVNLGSYDNQVDEFYSGTWANSEIFQLNDTTYQVILDGLNEGDIGAPGFVAVTLAGSEITVDDYTNGRANITESVLDVINAGTNQWWCLGYKKIFLVRDSSILKEVELDETYDKLFYDDEDRILIFQPYNSQSGLKYFDGETAVPWWTPPNKINDIRLFRGSTFVLYDGVLYQYSDNFLTANNIWQVPDDINDFNQIHITEDFVTFSSVENDTSRIIQCDYDNSCLTIATEVSPDEKITAVYNLGESELLLSGVSSYTFASQLFFRYKNLNLPSDYQKSQVSIVNAELTPLQLDSFPESIMGIDTTWYYEQKFEYTTTIRNDGSESISLADAYSEYYFIPPFGYNWFYLHSVFERPIAPQQIVERRDTFTFFPTENFDLKLGIPGAGLRFNESADRVIDLLNRSEVEDLSFNDDLKVYPNPSSEYITIETESFISALSIYSSDGKLISYKQGEFLDKKLAVHTYKPGLYYVLIKEKGNKQMRATTFIKI